MTGILTKKNVEDGAFVNSNSGNDNNDYESIYVKDDVIVDGDMILGGISVKSQLVNHEERITAVENKDMTIYAKKDEIPDLTPYVKKDEISTVDLSPYYTSAQVEEKFVDEDELAYEFNKYETKEVAEEKYALKTDIPTVDLEPLLTEVAADAKFATKDEVQEIKTNFQDNVEVIKSYTLEGDVDSDYYKFYRQDLFDFLITFSRNSEDISRTYYYSDDEVIPGYEDEKDRYIIFERYNNPVEMNDKYFIIDTEYNGSYVCDVLDDNYRQNYVFLKSMKILTKEVNQTYSTEIIELLINANVNEIKNETEKIYNELGMITSEIEETFATKEEIPNVDLTPYATKTHKINFEVDRKNGGNSFVFNLAKKPSSFSVKIVLRWTNSANEPDWVGITCDVINGTFQNIEVQNATSGTKKRFTFPGQEGSTQIRIDTSIAYWKDGVIRFLPCTSYFTDETLLNYDPDETYFTEYVTYGGDLEPYALKTDIPTIDLEPYALKTEIPEIPNDLVKETALENYVPKEGDSTITGSLTINNTDNYPLKLLNENIENDGSKIGIVLGKDETGKNAMTINYNISNNLGELGILNNETPAIQYGSSYLKLNNMTQIKGQLLIYTAEENGLCLFQQSYGAESKNCFLIGETEDYNGKISYQTNKVTKDYVIGFHNTNILFMTNKLNTKSGTVVTNITGNLTVTGTLTSANSTTITHLAPIEAGEEISDFKIGKPVFMSGYVYKRENATWISSSATDSTDCICSVTIDGTWKEFVGVVTKVDEENGNITFATHGDYLFYVDDANIYAVGDVLLYDGRILDEDYAMTLKIQQSIVGKVSAKINEHTLALFKS